MIMDGRELVTISQAEEMTTLERTTIWRKEKAGEFPLKAGYVAGRRVWLKADIEAWLKAELAKDAQHGPKNLNKHHAPTGATNDAA